MKRHVLLIGLPGAGKTAVGRRVAKRLQAPFVDIDEMIAREQGRSVSELFTERGEPAFRALESEAVLRAVAGAPQVVSPGGGWAAQPGSLEGIRGRGVTIWLEVDPAVAVVRATRSHARPLLEGADPLERMRSLIESRRDRYSTADATVDTTDLTADQAAEKVTELARSLAEW